MSPPGTLGLGKLPRTGPLRDDSINHGTDAILRQLPFCMRQPADQLEFQPLVDILRLVVVAEHVGRKRQRELRRAAAAIAPFESGLMSISA
jgi:hypothetical protein